MTKSEPQTRRPDPIAQLNDRTALRPCTAERDLPPSGMSLLLPFGVWVPDQVGD